MSHTEPSIAINEPSAGRSEGTIAWVQTDETAKLTIEVEHGEETGEWDSCEGAIAPFHYDITSSDGIVDTESTWEEYIMENGECFGRSLFVELDSETILAAGVAPSLPHVSAHDARITMQLTRPAGFTEGLVTLDAGQNHLTLALIEFP